MGRWRAALMAMLGGTSIAACGGSDGGNAPSEPSVVGLEVSPAVATLGPGASLPFTAAVRLSDNTIAVASADWTATGGSITGDGVYTAGDTPGTFRVVATERGGTHADTATVVITLAPPTLVAVEVAPPTATLVTGSTQQFTAIGRLSDQTAGAVTVTWTTDGGTVSATGLYTAPGTAGTHRVIATQQGGTLADTAVVTVTPPPNDIVAIIISPDSLRAKAVDDSVPVSALARRMDNSLVPVAVTWSSPVGAVASSGKFGVNFGSPNGRSFLVASEVGGTHADTIPVMVHNTTGESVVGPSPWAPTAGQVFLCTSNHFTDDPVGLTATATVTATPNVGTVTSPVNYATLGWGSYTNFPNGSSIDFVRVECARVYELPGGFADSVLVTVSIGNYAAGSGMAKIFTYENRNNPTGRADFTRQQDWYPPNFNTATVTESVWVKPTNGANIWFKNTRVPY